MGYDQNCDRPLPHINSFSHFLFFMWLPKQIISCVLFFSFWQQNKPNVHEKHCTATHNIITLVDINMNSNFFCDWYGSCLQLGKNLGYAFATDTWSNNLYSWLFSDLIWIHSFLSIILCCIFQGCEQDATKDDTVLFLLHSYNDNFIDWLQA